MKIFVFLSEVLGAKVIDAQGDTVGRLNDIVMKIGEEVYPKAVDIVIAKGFLKKEFAHIAMVDVQETAEGFQLRIPREKIVFLPEKQKNPFTLCQDILDRQVLDIDNQKVVRVNDVHLLRVDHQLYLAHVDVGLRGIVRRLGWTRGVDFFVRRFKPGSPYLTREDFISWKNTQALSWGRYKNVLRLDVARQKLSKIPTVELAEIMEDLDIFERLSLLRSLDHEVRQKVFAELATQEKHDLVEHMDEKEAISYLGNIPADEATDVLLTLPKAQTVRLLRMMETKTEKKLRKLLGFAKDSAGGLMTTEYLFVPAGARVKDALKVIKDNVNYPGNIYHLYVVDEQHRLLGATSLRQFINADADKPILETCHSKKIFVRTDDSMEEIALLLEKYKISSIPVVGEDDVLQGVITIDDVMEELIALAWKKYKGKLT